MRAQLSSVALLLAAAITLSGCSVLAPDYAHEAPASIPSEITEAGAELSKGDVARVANDDPAVDIAISIRQLKEFGPDFYDDLDNGSEFEEYTPIVAVVQYDTLDELTGDDRPTFYNLGGMLSNGEFAQALVDASFGGTGEVCPYSLDSTNGGDGTWRLSCVIYLVPEGETLESVAYYGFEPYSSINLPMLSDESGYGENPILWKL